MKKFMLILFLCLIWMISILPVMAQSENLLSPLKQFKSGSVVNEITCGSNLELVIKLENGQPACIKQNHLERLTTQGWEKSANVIFTCQTATTASVVNNQGFTAIARHGGLSEYVLKPNSTADITENWDLCPHYAKYEQKTYVDFYTFKQMHPSGIVQISISKFLSDNDTNPTFLSPDKTEWINILVNVTKFNDHVIQKTYTIKLDNDAVLGTYLMPVASGCPGSILTIGEHPHEGTFAYLNTIYAMNCPAQ